MKATYAILLGIFLLSGCSTIGTVRKAVFGDPAVDSKDKVEYAKLIEEKEAEFRKYREQNKGIVWFHYSAIVLVIGGVVLGVLSKDLRDEGALSVLCGFTLSSWGLLAPKYIAVPFTVFGGVVIFLVYYLVAYSRRLHSSKATDASPELSE